MSGLHIVVVDDSATARHYFCELLEEMGHHPHGVASGSEALKVLGQHSFDLVLCDLVMPDMDGLDLLNRARQQGRDLPFLLITSYGSLGTAVQAVRAGADDYILRPVDPGILAHRLETVMRRNSMDKDKAERQRLEAALATAGGVAHEMNQPLMAIMASAELMEMSDDPRRLKELAGIVVEQTERLGEITRRLVNLTRYRTKTYLGAKVILDLKASTDNSG